MKLKLFFTAQLILLFVAGMAQGKVKMYELCNTNDRAKQYFRSDTIIINCDTAYIINNTILNNYSKAIRANADCGAAIRAFEALSNVQDDQIEKQGRSFDELKAKFDSLKNNTGQFLAITQGSLSQVSDTLSYVSVKLTETKQLLIDAQTLLEKDREDRWKQKLRWGIGGFGIGLAATTLVFLVAR